MAQLSRLPDAREPAPVRFENGFVHRLWCLGLILVVGCHDVGDVRQRRDAIIDGAVSVEQDAVVGISADDEIYCSGTLVAANVVLTAAHCLPPDAPIAVGSVVVGASASEGTRVDAAAIWTHPEHMAGTSTRDFGLIALVDAVDVAPLEIGSAPAVASRVVIVGFGRSDPDAMSDDVKREGTAEVLAIDADTMLLQANPAVTCGGDSGGPALFDGRVVGVHARGSCELEMTEMRAENAATDVAAFIADHPPPTCAPDGGCGIDCLSPDADCPCAADTFCGEGCPADPDCAPAAPAEGCAFSRGRRFGRPWSWAVAALALIRRRRCGRRRARRSVR